mgnify:CR=1 FL=1
MVSRITHELFDVYLISRLDSEGRRKLTATVRHEVMSVLEGVVEAILSALLTALLPGQSECKWAKPLQTTYTNWPMLPDWVQLQYTRRVVRA